VIDWYNYIVQHNPTPAGFQTGKGNAFETDLRDKTHGRIYRVVYTKAKPEPRVNLKDAPPEKLVETLKHHNMGWRLHAQRLLVERGKSDVVPALIELITEHRVECDEIGLNPKVLHGIWALHGLGAFEDRPENKKALDALRTAGGRNPDSVERARGLALPRVPWGEEETPEHQQAILSHLLRMSDSPTGKAFGESRTIFYTLWPDEKLTPLIADALLMAAASHSATYLAADQSYFINSEMYPKHPNHPTLLHLLSRVAFHFALTGTEPELNAVLSALPKHRDPTTVAAIIDGLSAGWRDRTAVTLNDDAVKAVRVMLDYRPGFHPGWLGAWYLPTDTKARLIKLARSWGVKGIDAQLAAITKAALATVADAKAADAERVEAAKQVIELVPDGDDAANRLLAAVTPQTPPAVAAGIFDALGASKSRGVGAAVVARLKDLSPAVRPAALRLVLAKPETAGAFLDAVEKGTLRFDLLALDQKAALASSPDKVVAERAKKLLALGGGLPNADRQKVIDELMPAIKKTGDVASGKKVFTAQCAKCHKYAGEGTQIGPDLTGMAVHPKEELLIHILDPSRSVEGNYKAYRVVTVDGRTLVGLLAAESKTAVEVVDAEGKRHPLARDDIESLKETDKSLMPEGFEKQATPAEIADLLEFLTQKGKFVPLPLDRVATVVSTKDMFFDAGGTAERLVFPDWKPKTFAGVPFVLVDPQGEKVKNVVMLHGPAGKLPPTMPKSVTLPFNGKAKAIHLLSGVGGWNATAPRDGPVALIVRLTYADGTTEDHELKDGVHFADYIRRVDVPGSQFAFALRNQQVRYLAVVPKRPDAVLKTVEFVKGPHGSAPVVMAATVETP